MTTFFEPTAEPATGRAPPRLRGLPLVGCIPALALDPTGFAVRARERCGDVALVDIGPLGALYLLFHPEDIGELFAHGRRLHREKMRRMLGRGLFINQTGDIWRRQRRLLQPAFHASHLAKNVDVVTARVQRALDARWEELARGGAWVDLAEEMKRLTVDVMVAMTLGAELGADEARLRESLALVVDFVDAQLFSLATPPHAWPTPHNRRFRAALGALQDHTRRAAAARRARGELGDDLLGMFLAARDADTGAAMTDDELVDEVMSTFVAGTETTGTALTWTWYLLGQDPALARRLRAEAAAVLDGRRPALGDLAALRFTKNAVQEALRLYPPAWAMVRILEQPRTFGGFTLPAGARAMVSTFATHRHPALWDDPLRYDPDRFTPERSAGRPRFAYFPFGGGGHQCIGSEIALSEATLILAMVTQRFDLQLEAPTRLGVRPRIALMPRPVPRLRVRRATGDGAPPPVETRAAW